MIKPDKFTCSTKAGTLLTALQSASKCIYKANTIPIIGHCWLRFSGGSLLVTTTNLDQSITIKVNCEGSGQCTVSATRLLAFLSVLANGADISLSAEDAILVCKSVRSTHKIPTLPVADYPVVVAEPVKGSRERRIPTEELLAHTKRISPAIETGNRSYLMGINFSFGAMAATNGYILGEDLSGALEGGKKDDPSFTVPDDTIKMLGIFDDTEIVTVRLGYDGTSASFESADITLRTKLVDGSFPDYHRVIPHNPDISVSMNANEFLTALRIGANLQEARGDMPHVSVRMHFNRTSLTISTQNKDGEEASSECEFETLRGTPKELGVSLDYMLWAVESMSPKDRVELSYSDGGAILVSVPGIDDMRRVVMPRRI